EAEEEGPTQLSDCDEQGIPRAVHMPQLLTNLKQDKFSNSLNTNVPTQLSDCDEQGISAAVFLWWEIAQRSATTATGRRARVCHHGDGRLANGQHVPPVRNREQRGSEGSGGTIGAAEGRERP
ncbi:MAG: hypothetical protein ACXVZH_03420, partial [Terriglobales bacterium]